MAERETPRPGWAEARREAVLEDTTSSRASAQWRAESGAVRAFNPPLTCDVCGKQPPIRVSRDGSTRATMGMLVWCLGPEGPEQCEAHSPVVVCNGECDDRYDDACEDCTCSLDLDGIDRERIAELLDQYDWSPGATRDLLRIQAAAQPRAMRGVRAFPLEGACNLDTDCESPIERAFLEAVLARDWDLPELGLFSNVRRAAAQCPQIRSWKGTLVAPRPRTYLLTQVVVEVGQATYRLDAAVLVNGGLGRIAIELDGHDFHERTKEQARRDRSRDRALTIAGWCVLRFTGSEIYRGAWECVDDLELAIDAVASEGRLAPMMAAGEGSS